MLRIIDNNRGLSLIELVVTMVILTLLASLIIPSAQMTSKRTKELELKRNLREIRTAIDQYKREYDRAYPPGTPKVPSGGSENGYPETLQKLVEGEDFGGVLKEKKKFLRRIPKDPFYTVEEGRSPWGVRAYADEPDSRPGGEGGKDVYDVYSQSKETAIDGTKYEDW